jgi:hypothetical protein
MGWEGEEEKSVMRRWAIGRRISPISSEDGAVDQQRSIAEAKIDYRKTKEGLG